MSDSADISDLMKEFAGRCNTETLKCSVSRVTSSTSLLHAVTTTIYWITCYSVTVWCQHTVVLSMLCTAGWLYTRGAADSWQLLHHCRSSNDAEQFLAVVPERHRHCLLWHHLIYGWLLRVVSPGVWEQASDASADDGSRTAHDREPRAAVWVFSKLTKVSSVVCVADREQSITNAVFKTFPSSTTAYCWIHNIGDVQVCWD